MNCGVSGSPKPEKGSPGMSRLKNTRSPCKIDNFKMAAGSRWTEEEDRLFVQGLVNSRVSFQSSNTF